MKLKLKVEATSVAPFFPHGEFGFCLSDLGTELNALVMGGETVEDLDLPMSGRREGAYLVFTWRIEEVKE